MPAKGYSKESHDAHVLRMHGETTEHIAGAVEKIGKLVAAEGIGIALGALLIRITGKIYTVVDAKKNPLAQLREDFVLSIDRLMSLLNIEIPIIDVRPMGWLRPLLAYYKTLLEKTATDDGGWHYVALPLDARAELVIFFPAVARTSLHLFSALLGRT